MLLGLVLADLVPTWVTPSVDPRTGLPLAVSADVVAGAAPGAILGAAVSSPRHAGANAVIGAIFGAALGAAAGDARNRAYEDARARQAEAAERARVPSNNFRRAMSACMDARGYRVSAP